MTEAAQGPSLNLGRSVPRYQVMAIITGVFLVLVFVGMYVEYVVEPAVPWLLTTIDAVQTVHGFIYVVYLVTSIDLWSRAKWGWGRLVLLVLGGVVPLLSFWLERHLTREFAAVVDA